MIRTLLLSLLLASQDYQPNPQHAEPDLLRRERLRATHAEWSELMIITIVASFQDGQPARGYISCGGIWFKYADETEVQSGWNLPFRTDGRGAAIFNPKRSDYSGEWEGDQLTCWATSGVRSGKSTFTPRDGGVYPITIPGQR